METIAAVLLGISGGLTVFSFARPASSARVLLFAFFLGMTTLAAMAPSIHHILIPTRSAN